jgi:hypothetical protein
MRPSADHKYEKEFDMTIKTQIKTGILACLMTTASIIAITQIMPPIPRANHAIRL